MSVLQKNICTLISLKVLALVFTIGQKVPIIRILLKVTGKAIVLCGPLLEMLLFIMMIYATIGMALFGGNITSATPKAFNTMFGAGSWATGQGYWNFNDMWCSLHTLFSTIFGGWNGIDFP